jgi:hypothetical protein
MTFLQSPDALSPVELQPEALEGVSVGAVDPLLATESLPLVDLQNYYDGVDQALVHLPARRLSARVSHCIEVARSPETSGSHSAVYFEQATEAAECIVAKHPDAPYLEVVETSLLTTFIPAFRNLRGSKQPTSDVIGDIYERLGDLMGRVVDAPLTARNRAGFEAKLAMLALGARLGTTETLYLPPTTRESRNVGSNKRFNHSIYGMDRGQKVAARVRFSHKNTAQLPHPNILSLSFSGIVRQTARQLRSQIVTPQSILEALYLEANGRSAGGHTMLLDELSDVVRTTMLYFSKADSDLL